LGNHKDFSPGREARSLILALTNREDYTADWLLLELRRREADFVRFNTEDWPMRVKLVWQDDGRAELQIGERLIKSNELTSVWYRRPVPPRLPAEFAEGQSAWAAGEAREALGGFWRTTEARWINPPLAEAAASSKPEQLRRAQRHGLVVPETRITNDVVEAAAFAAAGPTVCKPLGHGAITTDDEERLFFTRLIDADDIAAMSTLGPEPYFFQRLVPKQHDLRVTVIGGELFAVRIDSQVGSDTEIDWRCGDANQLDHVAVDLPADIAERVLALVADYGLSFAAVDFAVDHQGRYVFFEINPSGQWAWLEERTGLPLRSRLATLLIGN
jgi:hypothetical protein